MSTGITPLTPAEQAEQEKQAAHEGYIRRNLVAFDVECNVLTGGLPDETISSRLARDAQKHKLIGEIGSKALNLITHNHGAHAQAGDVERAKAVIEAEVASGDVK